MLFDDFADVRGTVAEAAPAYNNWNFASNHFNTEKNVVEQTRKLETKNIDMKKSDFFNRLSVLEKKLDTLLCVPNEKAGLGNGVIDRYKNPVLTAQHAPLFWRYDLNPETNPHLMERFGINAVLNAGAIKWNNKYLVVARVEASTRKSFFAVAESANGIDNFVFWDYPVNMPET